MWPNAFKRSKSLTAAGRRRGRGAYRIYILLIGDESKAEKDKG